MWNKTANGIRRPLTIIGVLKTTISMATRAETSAPAVGKTIHVEEILCKSRMWHNILASIPPLRSSTRLKSSKIKPIGIANLHAYIFLGERTALIFSKGAFFRHSKSFGHVFTLHGLFLYSCSIQAFGFFTFLTRHGMGEFSDCIGIMYMLATYFETILVLMRKMMNG